MRFVTTILLIAVAFGLQAQEKQEREWRVKKSEVPQAALDWFKDAYELPKKVKWYGEQNETGRYFEAKLKWKKQKHSVKFSEAGDILDIEIELTPSELPQEVWQTIDAKLNSVSTKYRLIKLQQQWTGDADDLEDLIDENEEDDLTIRYEIELFGGSGEKRGYFEALFSDKGELLLYRPIQTNTADHLHF